MTLGEAPDRRRPATRGSAGLRERDAVLDAIRRLLDAAQDGTGQALLIEGHAGLGKTRLQGAALDQARARGMRVLHAAGAELEQTIAFGLASRLLDAQLAELAPARRRSVLARAPEALRLLTSGAEPRHGGPTVSDLALSHALFALLAAADERPALIAIDDLHWIDTASLEFVLYLLHRLEELPLALLLTRRIGTGAADSGVLDRIATHRSIQVEKLAPLGAEAVAELVAEAVGERTGEELALACFEATRGNPFYLHELLLALTQDRDLGPAELVDRARALAPDAVIRSLRVRIGRLGPAAGALAEAVGILGDDVPLRHAAALAGIELREAAEAADTLAAVEILLAREPLSFAHPLVKQAVLQDIAVAERAGRHLEAARLLAAEGLGAERVAVHLLRGSPPVCGAGAGAGSGARVAGVARGGGAGLRAGSRRAPARPARPRGAGAPRPARDGPGRDRDAGRGDAGGGARALGAAGHGYARAAALAGSAPAAGAGRTDRGVPGRAGRGRGRPGRAGLGRRPRAGAGGLAVGRLADRRQRVPARGRAGALDRGGRGRDGRCAAT